MGERKQAALYVRVSTDRQSVENQIAELTAVAKRRGWEIVQIYRDEGISGAKGREDRPGLDAMLKDAGRGKFDVIMAWSIDRLGRSLSDLLRTMQELEAFKVDIFVDQQGLDTTTPMGRLIFQVTGAFAEFERAMIRQRVRAGLKRAVASGKALGRPPLDGTLKERIKVALDEGGSIRKVADKLKTSRGTVWRVAQGVE
jgi:DNA invertase Pin-like site-specific DNA recombinase